MNNARARVALLAGASLVTLVEPAAATAATVVDPGISHIVGPGAVVSDTLTICDISDDCAFGVQVTNSPSATAVVDSVPTGRIEQIGSGGDITLSLANDGSADVRAIASATNPISAATAFASIHSGVVQGATATGHIALDLDNSGSLNLAANAVALAPQGTARASAVVESGVVEIARGPTATAILTNSGDIDIVAVAQATGTHVAAITTIDLNPPFGPTEVHPVPGAKASVEDAIFQFAHAIAGSDVLVSLDNSGTIVVDANAKATATGSAAAAASMRFVLEQVAESTGNATAVFDNSGEISITAHAAANADPAMVTGTFFYFSSAGTQTFSTRLPGAAVNADFLISQLAAADDASVIIENSGNILESVSASAIATDGAAVASAFMVFGGIHQSAHGSSHASVSLENSGTIAMTVSAKANGTVLGDVLAAMSGIEQGADATSSALVVLENSGDIELSVIAAATGTGFAGAFAGNGPDDAIGQFVKALSAQASLKNQGVINVDLSASVNGGTRAIAQVDLGGILQFLNGANVSATISNGGELNFGEHAIAHGGTGASALLGDANTIIDQNVVGFLYTTYTTQFTTSFGGIVTNTHQALVGSGAASASLTNSGILSLVGQAEAVASSGIAVAKVNRPRHSVDQIANGVAANDSLTNTGTLSEMIRAYASGVAGALASVIDSLAIHQSAMAVSEASVRLDNQGTIEFAANAHAVAQSGIAVALGGGSAVINQYAKGSSASASFINGGKISIAAAADAAGASGADAVAGAWFLAATAEGNQAHANLANDGTIFVSGIARAVAATGAAVATALASGVEVAAAGMAASATAVNSGSISIAGNAFASGAMVASAAAFAADIFEVGLGLSAHESFFNGGELSASDHAVAIAASGPARAIASAYAILQYGTGAAVTQRLTNNGMINVVASALASGNAHTSTTPVGSTFMTAAGAVASGVRQTIFSGAPSESFANSGMIDVRATAVVEREDIVPVSQAGLGIWSAVARAIGYKGFEFSHDEMSADIVNSGSIEVDATAVSPGLGIAAAVAQGIVLENAGSTFTSPTDSGGTNIIVHANPISGTLTNSGTIDVAAIASGGLAVHTTSGGHIFFSMSHEANGAATGILISGGVNTMTVTNTGTIIVDAVVTHGPFTEPYDTFGARASGLRVVANGFVEPDPDAVFTFTNDGGTIIVRQSSDGGPLWIPSWARGMAIDLSDVPNASVINLLGDGFIYGNIDIQSGDAINVRSGTTRFDGIINPENIPVGGFPAPILDTGAFGDGTLKIAAGGNLLLADPRLTGDLVIYDGPAYAFVDTLNMGADGTLTFELQPISGGAQPTATLCPLRERSIPKETLLTGCYPQVFTDTANLDGKLVADVTLPGSLFEDSYFWDNVIDANVRNGTFDNCALAGPYTNSVLLSLQCVYDNKANVDLSLTRVAFGAVGGLNANGVAAGSGLECLYDVNLTGGFADMLADLFLFADPANYNIALNMLSGSSYANYLDSFASLGVHENDLVDHATNCEIPALGGSVLECRGGGPVHVWGQLDYQTRKADGDVEAGDSRSKRFTGLLGFDANVGSSAILGVDGGYISNHFRDHRFGDDMKGDGWTIGAYGIYDPGPWFLKGVTTYSSLNGDSTRHVDFAGLAPGATFAATVRGNPDIKMWTFGLHGGGRFNIGANSVLTPYLNYDYVNAKMDGFIENGSSGAELHLAGNGDKHSFLTGGAKWATQMGGVVPEVNFGYRHRFGDPRADIEEAFQCQIDICAFDIVSASQKRGTFLAGLSVGGKVGPVDLRIGYEGEFNSGVTSHSGNFKIVLPLGGHAALPPPPPPPPPPVVEQPAPPPPPPPPPLPPAPERGQ